MLELFHGLDVFELADAGLEISLCHDASSHRVDVSRAAPAP
jgi:hypothetical protein